MTTKNLQCAEAAAKTKELAEAIDVTMLCTNLSKHFFDGSKVQLLYSDPGSM